MKAKESTSDPGTLKGNESEQVLPVALQSDSNKSSKGLCQNIIQWLWMFGTCIPCVKYADNFPNQGRPLHISRTGGPAFSD